jgi:hypothetical protein
MNILRCLHSIGETAEAIPYNDRGYVYGVWIGQGAAIVRMHRYDYSVCDLLDYDFFCEVSVSILKIRSGCSRHQYLYRPLVIQLPQLAVALFSLVFFQGFTVSHEPICIPLICGLA